MFRRSTNPEKDDTLIAFRSDGNIIVDPNVRQEFGRLVCDDHGWLLRRVPPVPIYEWIDPDQPPYEKGRAFVIAREQPWPEQDEEFVNYTVPVIYKSSSVGETWRQRKDKRRRRLSLGVTTAALALVFALTMTVMPLIVGPTIAAPDQPVVAEGMPQ